MSRKALKAVRIADFSWVIAGPAITTLLGSYGATVIRIETSYKPELLRTAPPFRDGKPGINRSGGFALFNNNKYGVTLNLNHPKGIEIARDLIRWADIVVENFIPGTMEKWGLGYSDIITFKPDIIMLSTCMQGQDGPRATHPGYGGQLTSLCGFTHLCGWPDRMPVRPSSGYTDVIGPRFGEAALVAALIYRLRKGKGQYFDLSQFEAGLQFLAPAVMDYMVNKRVAYRNGNRHPFWTPHGAYPCKGDDNWCVIAVTNDQEWQSLCRAFDDPLLARDPRFITILDRKKNQLTLFDF